jgi:putative 2OG-Fe(II) oxygenase
MDREALVEQVRRDGVVFFRNLVDPGLADRALRELSPWFTRDIEERTRTSHDQTAYTGNAGYSTLTHSTHILTDVYGKSPALDQIMEKILTDPISASVLERMAGKNIKFRGYNVRLMTGSHDPSPTYPAGTAIPHEWHRDSPGEMGIGLLLTDVPEGGNGGTAFTPCSHLFPYCPRWNALFSPKIPMKFMGKVYTAASWLARLNLFSRILGRKVLKNARESTGTRGDVYFFFNDVWHGRYPNVHGRKSMIVLVGLFPTEMPFPDQVNPPPPEVLQVLPETVRRAAATTLPPNKDKAALVHWMLANQQRLSVFSWFFWAKAEKKLVEAIYLPSLVTRYLLGQIRAFMKTSLRSGPKENVAVAQKAGAATPGSKPPKAA